MNKKRIQLDNLKLKSFVTDVTENMANTAKGGSRPSTIWDCTSYSPQNSVCTCPIH